MPLPETLQSLHMGWHSLLWYCSFRFPFLARQERPLNSLVCIQVIDLRKVSPELCEEAMNADLVILEGMGRSIETNLNAQFVCDVLKLGMIKHPEVWQQQPLHTK